MSRDYTPGAAAVPAVPAEAPAPVTARHIRASSGPGYLPDTETWISYTPGSSRVYVHVQEIPGLRWWSCPPADVLRKWVDALIKPHGVKRDGPRMEVNSYFSGWKFQYWVKPAAALTTEGPEQ